MARRAKRNGNGNNRRLSTPQSVNAAVKSSQEDRRTPEELLDLIEAKGREVAEAVAALRALRSRADISP